MLRFRTRAAVAMALLVVGGAGVALAQSPPGSAGAKAATKCQQTIAKANAKFVAQRLKRLAACGNGVLACVQTLSDPTACVGKVTVKCRKQLGTPDVADAAAAKLEAAVVKACGALSASDLLAAGGLGFDDAGPACGGVGVPELASAADVARCLQRLHAGLSEGAYGAELPRAAELTALADVSALVVSDLPPYDGCGGCGTPSASTGKAVAGCGAAIAKAGANFLAKARAGLDKCAAGLVACTQTKPGDPGCAAKAKATCEKLPGDVAKERASLVSALAKKCGGALGFATLDAPVGINLGALACECKQVGIEPVASLNDYALCLTRQHECGLAALLPTTAPRVDGLLADQGLAIDDLLCAPTTSTAALAGIGSGPRANFGFFGNILKFVKKVTPGSLRPSAAPFANRGSARRVGRPTFGGCHAKPGGSCTFRFPITKKPATLQKTRGQPLPPPALVLAVQRADGSFADDHFEIDLADTTNDSEVEVVVEYADDLESCAFELAATVAEDGVVAPYTTVEQVPHVVPGNDICTEPRGIEGTTFSEVLDVTAATTLVDEPATPCAGSGMSNTVFYAFTAPTNGIVTADTFGSDYDTVVALWTGTCGAPVHQTCADNTGNSFQSKIAMPVAQGTTYLIGVGSRESLPPESSTLHFAFRFDAAGDPPTIAKLDQSLISLPPTPLCGNIANQSAFKFTFEYQDVDGDVLPTTAQAFVHAQFEPSGSVSDFSVFPLDIGGDGFAGKVSMILCTFFSADTSVVTTIRLGDLAGAGNGLSVKTPRPPGAL